MDEVKDVCLEEVALEGLDGITVDTLWLRLENREPRFNLKLDVFAKNAIWKSLVSCEEVQFYMLPSPRKLPTLPSEIRMRDPVTGIIQILPQEVENPYPVHIISGDQYKVQGSCSTFSTRKHVTEEIRKADGTFKLTLDQAVEKFGDTLVLVASQETRLRMLYGPDSCQSGELSGVVYAFLEWIGRHRHYGAFQPDAVKALNTDHKMAFYYRKFLTSLGIVSFQSIARQEIPKKFTIVNLLFLKRKTVLQPHSRYGLMAEDVSKFLENTPHRMAVFSDVREYLLKKHELVDADMFRRNVGLMKSMGLTEKLTVPHSVARGYKKFPMQGSHDREISVGIIRLIKPYRVDQEEKEEAEEEEMSDMNIKDSILYKGRSLLDQVYHFLSMNYFQDGKAFTRAELCNYFKLSRNYMRTLLRRLETINLVKGEMVEMGRQRALAFIPVKVPAGHTKHDSITMVTDQLEESSSQKPEDKASGGRKERTDKKDKGLSTVTPKMNFSAARAEKRRKLMQDLISENKVLSGCYSLLRKIRQQESKEGIKTKVDVKSLKRILKKMVEDKDINEYQVQLEPTNIASNKLTIYTIPGIERDHHLVADLIKQEEFNRHGKNVDANRHTLRKRKATKKEKKIKEPETVEEEEDTEMEGEEEKGSKWDTSYLPKMPRLQTTHHYLWYIINDPILQAKSEHCGKKKRNHSSESSKKTETVASNESDDDVKMPATGGIQSAADVGGQSLSEDTPSSGNKESGPSTPETEDKVPSIEREKSTTHPTKHPAGREQTPTVHADTKDWKRFIAPLPPLSKDEAPGWFQLGEILTRMPLLIFNQTCSTGPLGGSVSKYLGDPIKRYFPLCELPRKMKAKLQQNRAHITKLEQNLKLLSKFGLIWIGPSEKSKEQRWFYLSTKGVLKDTTSSDLSYMHVTEKDYPEMKYEFNSLEDVGKYWSDCKGISLNTPLGLLKDGSSTSTTGVRREVDSLKDLLLHWDSIKTKPDKEGILKGDGRGACGVDSSTFAHLRRNWIWISSDVSKPKTDKKDEAGGEEDTKAVKRSSRKKREVTMLKDGKMVAVPIAVKHVSSQQHKEESKGGKGLKRKSLAAPNPAKKTKGPKLIPTKRGTYFDERDQMARMRMKTRRALWSSKEDNFILLCCIASEILNEKVTRAFVTWKDIRNIMHEHLEVSKDKSSFAISKRATYIFKYPQTHVNYATCLTEIREDEELINSFMSRKEDYTDPEVCVKEYREFLERLIEKYKKQASGDVTWLTDLSYVDLKAKYNIVVASNIKEPRRQKMKRKEKVETKSDIEKAVIQSLIMGALHTQSYSGYSPSVMFEIFNQYDESLLHDAFMYLREVSICSRWRHLRELTFPSLKRVLPHVPMSYQLSQVYYKFFMSRITKETLQAAADFLNAVEAENDLLDIPMDPSGEHSAVALAMLAMGQGKLEVIIPEQIILFDKNDTEESNVKAQDSRKRPLEEDSDDDDDEDDDDNEEEDKEDEEMEKDEAELLRLLSETQAELNRYGNLQDGSAGDNKGSTPEAMMEQKNVKLKVDETMDKKENELSNNTTLSSSDTPLTPSHTQSSTLNRSSSLSDTPISPPNTQSSPSIAPSPHYSTVSTPSSTKSSPSNRPLPLSNTPSSSSNTSLSPSKISYSSSKRLLQTKITSSSPEIVQEDSAVKQVLGDSNERISKAENVDTHLQLPTALMSTGNNLLLLRGHFKRQLNSLDTISIKDEVVINSCDLKLSLNADSFLRCEEKVEEFTQFGSMLEFMSSEKYLSNPFVPFSYHSPVSRCAMNVEKWLQLVTIADKEKTWESFEHNCKSLSKFQDQMEDLKQVYQFINGRKFLGVTLPELKKEYFDWNHFMKKANILIKEEMILEVGSDQLRLVTIENASPWVITSTLNESKDMRPRSSVHEGLMQYPLIGKELHVFDKVGTAAEYPVKETEKEDSKMEETESQVKEHESKVSQEEAVETSPEVAGIISGMVSDENPATSETRNGHQRGEKPSTSEVKTSQGSLNMVYRQYYRIDGTTNYSQIQMLLIRVANFVIENPGYKEEDICIFMEPILHHVECLELLQKLTTFGCISRHVKKYRKFRNPFDRDGHLHGYAYYMPAVDCLLRLSLLTTSLVKGSQP